MHYYAYLVIIILIVAAIEAVIGFLENEKVERNEGAIQGDLGEAMCMLALMTMRRLPLQPESHTYWPRKRKPNTIGQSPSTMDRHCTTMMT